MNKADQVRALTNEIYSIDLMKGQDAIVELAEYYKGKYANWANVALYHPMTGSTPWTTLSQEDFPEQDSVLAKLEEIKRELSQS
jgi:hypothetical protein